MRSSSRFSALGILYGAALRSVDPETAVARAHGRAAPDGIFAVGKAAAGMFRGARAFAKGALSLVVLPRGCPAPEAGPRGRVLFASHPEPDRSSLHAAREALTFFAGFGPGETILCLISGGTSSLLCLPRHGVTLSAKRRAVRRLAVSGASIVELNRLRSSLSAIKGGGLGLATAARLVTLVLSDVPGDRPSLVGSGPTIRHWRRDLVRVVGSNVTGREAAAREAARRGWKVSLRARRLSGEAREEGARFARAAKRLAPGSVLIAGGETAVRLSSRHGSGGRNLEFALGAALELDGSGEIALLAAGSDGIDGSSRAAGAFADGATIARARRLGLDAERCLCWHDTEKFFQRLGDLLVTGPTGTNVGDWAFALRAKG